MTSVGSLGCQMPHYRRWGRFELWFIDRLVELALGGVLTRCAAGFSEWYRAFGPLAILYNSDGCLGYLEVHIFGRLVYSAD